MANPTQATSLQAQNAKSVGRISTSGSIDATPTLNGQAADDANSVILTIVANGTISLTESSTRNLSLSVTDGPQTTTQWKYGMGLNPANSMAWTLSIRDSNNNTFTFTKGTGGV